MSVSNGIITAPVSIKDVQEVLGETSNDLATLCKSSNINMWAKYKPVSNNSYFVDIKANWRGKYENANIEYSTVSSINLIKNLYSSTGDSFSYTKVGSPYRLADFNGYNHNVSAPVSGFAMSKNPTNNSVSGACMYGLSSTSEDNITMSDLLDIGDTEYYFGIALYNTKGLVYCRTASSGGGYTVEFKNIASGTYTAYPFMSSVKYDSSDINEAMIGTYVPLPNCSPQTVTVISEKEQLAKVVTLIQTAKGMATLENKDTKSHIVSVQLRYITSKDTDAMVIGESILIQNKTLEAGTSQTLTFALKMESGSSYKLLLYVDYTLVGTQAVLTEISEAALTSEGETTSTDTTD